MFKRFFSLLFVGGPADGLSVLAKAPLAKSYEHCGRTYARDKSKDRGAVRVFVLVPPKLVITP